MNEPGFETATILQALQLIHNPSTSNDERRQASEFLEQVKTSPNAAGNAFVLARDDAQLPLVRHFGLSILDHIIRHHLHELDHGQSDKLRKQVIDLGISVKETDPLFIRNKIAELWIDLAKRSWALDWFDLDQLLCGLWYQGHVQQDFVLTVLENLSDDTFVREDTTAILRGKDLNSALVEIFTSPADYSGGIKVGSVTQHVRSGQEGWLRRISECLNAYPSNSASEASEKATALRAMAALRSAFGWIMSSAVVSADCLSAVCNCLMKQDEDLLVATLDALLALYSRHNFDKPEMHALIYPLSQPSSIAILQQVYNWSIVDIDEIDSGKYTISKKISELVSLLSDNLILYNPPSHEELDLAPFLQFTIIIAQHQSLIVSIPAVHAWAKLLQLPRWRRSPIIGPCVAPLLNVVCSRMIQYDQVPESDETPEVRFVNEEIEIHHERTGFFMNYRRLCMTVIDWVCYTHLEQAIEFILVQVTARLNEIKQADAASDISSYRRISPLSLQADAQFAIVESAFKGFERWQNIPSNDPQSDDSGAADQQLGKHLRDRIKSWATELLENYQFRDPQVRQRMVKALVEISSRALQKDTAFALTVLDYILACFLPTLPDYPVYTDAVIDLHSYCTAELRRLAIYHADYFATFYEQLTSRFADLVNNVHVDAKVQTDLKAVLFLIVQRAHTDRRDQQQERLWTFLEPVQASWESKAVQDCLVDFDTYARSQHFHLVAPFMDSMNARAIEDWATVENNAAGVELQQQMVDAFYRLPLRESRVLLSLSTERLAPGSQEHKLIVELWMRLIGTMLFSVLRLTSYNHQLHDPASWPDIKPDQIPIIRRILRDRYWQSGISEGSMNEFHQKVKSSKASLEGFASSVRSRIRTNLEQCYSIIHTLGKLGEEFYSLEKLPAMLAESLLSSSSSLSPHHLSIMLAMLPKLIEDCPPHLRSHFLTPILTELLVRIDAKLTTEWANISQKKSEHHEGEDLKDEMRDDSVLRQTTYRAVNMVAAWVDQKREEQIIQKKAASVNGDGANFSNGAPTQSFHDFVLSNQSILERLLVFIVHALTYKDTKSCYNMVIAAQRIVPAFATPAAAAEQYAPVREYISDEMVRAAVMCIHDGYYAEYQQYYAQLIAIIWLYYGLPTVLPGPATGSGASAEITRPALTNTPRNVLAQLPGMTDAKLVNAANDLLKEGIAGKAKKLRAIILKLLDGVRGVRISELGKIDQTGGKGRILELYKRREGVAGMEGAGDGEMGAQQSRRIEHDGAQYAGIGELLK
ncbi:hypothetical protein DV738_g5358, partial [Chaetothyriales sp. CBS 135597]